MHEISCDDSREFVAKEEAADVLFVFSVTAVVKGTLIHYGARAYAALVHLHQEISSPGPQ